MISFQKILRKGAWFSALLVMACTGGAGGPVGGAPVGGGPVGGGNFAAGPVSLPSSSNTPGFPTDMALIACVKMPGPDVHCWGRPESIAPNTVLEFKIYPPHSQQARDSFSVTVNADGSWEAIRPGVPGERLEICILVNGACHSKRYVTIPAENKGVEPSEGTSKSLVIDAQGKGWHSRLIPKRGWLGWLIGEAHAEASSAMTMVECRGVTAEPEADGQGAPRCHLFSHEKEARAKVEMSFDNCHQSDISAIVAAEDPVSGEELLLVAIKRVVHVVKIGANPRILKSYTFPDPVAAVIHHGTHYAVLTRSLERPMYFLDLRVGNVPVACYELDEDLRGLAEVTQSHSLNNHFALSGLFQSEGVSEYRVVTGSFHGVGFEYQQAPVTLLRSDSPMEVQVLQASDTEVVVAVLQPNERKIKFIRHRYYQPGVYLLYMLGGGSGDQITETSLADLQVFGEPYAVQGSQLLAVDHNTKHLGFFDFANSTTNLVTLRYYVPPSGAVEAPRTAVVTDINNKYGPAWLKADSVRIDGFWNYAINHGDLFSLQPEQELVRILGPIEGDS